MLVLAKHLIMVAVLAGNPGCKTATTTTVVAEMAGNPGFKTATTTTVVAELAENPGFKTSITTAVVVCIEAVVTPTVTNDHSTCISCLLTRGNLPLRNLGHVLD